MGCYRNQISCILIRRNDNTESQEPSCRISQMTWDPGKNTLFQWGPEIFPKLSEHKASLWSGYKTLPFIGRRDIFRNRGDNFSKIIDWGSHQGTSHRGTWTECFIEPLTYIKAYPSQCYFRKKMLCQEILRFCNVGNFN